MECWQLQFNRVEEVCELNISFKEKFSPEIKFNFLMRKKMKANLNESSRFQLNRTEKTTDWNGSLPRATGPPLSALIKEQHKLHKKPFPWLGESTDENKALLFFTGWEAEFKVLAIPYNPLGHCLRKDFLTAIWFAMFENSVKIKLLHIPIFTHELIRQNRQSNWT